jgi:hypothetical protein
MIRRALIGGLTAGLMLILTAGTAIAAPETTTNREHALVETFVDVVPMCDDGGAPYRITTTSNLVEHETVFDDGRVHATFTQTGKFVAAPLRNPTLPSFAGSFTTWGNFNQNGSVVNGTSIFNVRGMGSDGSMLRVNQVEHFNERPDGSVNEFFRCH